MSNPIILFYQGNHPDDHGRYLNEILQQDDDWLEYTHNYIQWLFPNLEPSRVTPDAPILTHEVIDIFHHNETLQQHLRESFFRMLTFYGLQWHNDRVDKGPAWKHRKSNWFIRDTHNNLRITRILKCLAALGLNNEADAFLHVLKDLIEHDADCGISKLTQHYWSNAINESLNT